MTPYLSWRPRSYNDVPVLNIVLIDQLLILFASLGTAIQSGISNQVQMLINFKCCRRLVAHSQTLVLALVACNVQPATSFIRSVSALVIISAWDSSFHWRVSDCRSSELHGMLNRA